MSVIVVFWPIWPIAVGINCCCCYASVLTVLRRLSIFTNQKSEANALPLKVRNFSCTGTVVTWLLSEKRVRQFHACNNFLILIISWCSLVWLFVCFLYGNVGDLLPITVNGENKVVSDLIKLNLYSCFCVLFLQIFSGGQNREMNILTIYDIQNKFVAYSAPFPHIFDILCEWGSLYILTKDRKVGSCFLHCFIEWFPYLKFSVFIIKSFSFVLACFDRFYW